MAPLTTECSNHFILSNDSCNDPSCDNYWAKKPASCGHERASRSLYCTDSSCPNYWDSDMEAEEQIDNEEDHSISPSV